MFVEHMVAARIGHKMVRRPVQSMEIIRQRQDECDRGDRPQQDDIPSRQQMGVTAIRQGIAEPGRGDVHNADIAQLRPECLLIRPDGVPLQRTRQSPDHTRKDEYDQVPVAGKGASRRPESDDRCKESGEQEKVTDE